MADAKDNKKGLQRNERGEVIYKICDEEYIFSPTMTVIDKVQMRYGSIFEMLGHFDGSGNEKGRNYTIKDLIEACRILTNDAIKHDDNEMGNRIIRHGMMKLEVPITAVLMDVLLTGTDSKAKGAGKPAS